MSEKLRAFVAHRTSRIEAVGALVEALKLDSLNEEKILDAAIYEFAEQSSADIVRDVQSYILDNQLSKYTFPANNKARSQPLCIFRKRKNHSECNYKLFEKHAKRKTSNAPTITPRKRLVFNILFKCNKIQIC
jgi:uncharacterized membrane protein YvbJ